MEHSLSKVSCLKFFVLFKKKLDSKKIEKILDASCYRPVVLMVHGLSGGAPEFFVNPPESSPGRSKARVDDALSTEIVTNILFTIHTNQETV